ncbi:MAG TPA: hypothetical protein PKY81_17925 [bacterium]|nr:hypothetical protein [bacterium]
MSEFIIKNNMKKGCFKFIGKLSELKKKLDEFQEIYGDLNLVEFNEVLEKFTKYFSVKKYNLN